MNHHWPAARRAALQRDGYHCTACGSDGTPAWIPWTRLLLAILRPPTPLSFKAWRDEQWTDVWESADPALRASLRRAHDGYRERLMLPHQTALRELGEASKRAGIEVHHVIPCRGRHSIDGCWHHQDNLRSLCHDCHVGARQLILA